METSKNSEYLYDNLEDHQINETDFTKSNCPNIKMINRVNDPYKENINIGNLSIETPLSFLLKRYYMKNISCYISHKKIFLNGCKNDPNYIFLTEEDILITSEYDEEAYKVQINDNKEIKNINNNNNNDLNNNNNNKFENISRRFSKVNPILMRIEYRQVKILFFLLFFIFYFCFFVFYLIIIDK
jgi:hypothetical protein